MLGPNQQKAVFWAKTTLREGDGERHGLCERRRQNDRHRLRGEEQEDPGQS